MIIFLELSKTILNLLWRDKQVQRIRQIFKRRIKTKDILD